MNAIINEASKAAAEEKEAASAIVESVGRWPRCHGRPWRRPRRGVGTTAHMNAEFQILLGKKLSALEIRDFVSGEFEPIAIADVMAVLRARETAGTIRLVPKPVPPAPSKKKG